MLCMNVYSISSLMSTGLKICGEMLHRIEISILQHCQLRHESLSNDVSLKHINLGFQFKNA